MKPEGSALAAGGALPRNERGQRGFSTLKATKRAATRKASDHSDYPRDQQTQLHESRSSATAERKTMGVLSLRSAAMIAGTMMAKETSTAGR